MAAARLTEALRTRLLNNDTFVATGAKGVYPDDVPQGATNLPGVAYHVLTDRRLGLLAGRSQLRLARVQYDCIAESRQEADRLADAVEEAIDDAAGRLEHSADPSDGATHVDDCTQDNRYTTTDPPRVGEQRPRYRTTVDFEVAYHADALSEVED